MKLRNILKISACASLLLVGCDDMFEPNIENNKDFNYMLSDPKYIQGLLMQAYSQFNDDRNYYSNRIHEDFATSDFYTCQNDASENDWVKMGRGTWSDTQNPLDKWSTARNAIQYINIFLETVDKEQWAADEEANTKFKQRLTGEAYALRGIVNYFFLRAHCGPVQGKLMGIPIVTASEDVNSDFNIPREDFQTCLTQIFNDLDEAIKLLPAEYEGDDRVNGKLMRGLISGNIAKAVKSQVALMAASPLYQGANDMTWEKAAQLCADALNGHTTIVPGGNTWYTNAAEIENIKEGSTPPEVLWRGDRLKQRGFEEDCFPPTLYGKGQNNPTQNLVDAFPAANGFPITDARSKYDPQNPYINRDPRLDLYIIHDGSTFKGAVINTCSNGDTDDGFGKGSGKGTGTGYYLKKFLREDVSADPNNQIDQFHYKARIRYTELFLNYAEAQFEASGNAMSAGPLGVSPYEIIKQIRERAGITDLTYLDECAQDPAKFRALLHNERRIELMGENFRFWDLRRWNEPISETVNYINITATGSTRKYEVRQLSNQLRLANYMYYGPIPNDVVIKWSNTDQNDNW